MEVKVVKIFIRVLVLERFHASKSVMVRLFLEAGAIIQIFGQWTEPATTWTPVALARTASSVFIRERRAALRKGRKRRIFGLIARLQYLNVHFLQGCGFAYGV